ncbi:MAG TPA: SprT family zinc-dependent metalloprotease [Ignavibacteriaceae bacterium]
MEKTIRFEGIGDVLFRHSSRARYLNISVRPFHGVRVSIPTGMSYNSATRLVNEKRLWIQQHLVKMKEFEKQQTMFDENSGYCTKHHKLYLSKANRKNISVRISRAKINVIYPTRINSDSIAVQAAIRKGIERALKVEAKQFLPDKVKHLAVKFEFNYNKLTLKNIKSRWGSCSKKNNINLSVHLMRLPDHLIDYVILHELVHTVHHNHSKRFWAMLDTVSGGAKILDKELGKHRIAIY